MLTLVIANKNYSSWSLRAWLTLRGVEIPFDEVRIPLSTPTTAAEIARYSPAGRVPVLIDPDAAPGGLAIWDTLAIAEYAAERFPDRGLWPAAVADRARARSLCAEMHSGFSALRSAWPMNIRNSLPGKGWSNAVQRDLDRIVGLWRDALERSGGPLLFGAFTVADAFFAPVVSRLATYAAALPADAATYRDRVLALAAMREWTDAARAESEFVAEDEPYRLPT